MYNYRQINVASILIYNNNIIIFIITITSTIIMPN
jgi:hypothetical protein